MLVVEDEPLTRGLVVALLESAGFETRNAADARTAIKLIKQWDPDGLVVDLTLAGSPGGAEVLAAAELLAPGTALVILTNAPTPAAAGVNPRDIPPQASYLSKREVLSGQLLLTTLEEAFAELPPRRDDQDSTDPLAALTPDQLEVLRLVADGMSNSAIAAHRGTSSHAVELMVQRILRLLGLGKDPDTNARVLAARIYLNRLRELP